MKKIYILFGFVCLLTICKAQIIDIQYPGKTLPSLIDFEALEQAIQFMDDIDTSDTEQKMELSRMMSSILLKEEENEGVQFLKNGFVDFLSDGNIQASARLLRLNIGEKDKFYLPFYIYTGASGQAFGDNKQPNLKTISNLLNPIGGTLNLSFNGLANLKEYKEEEITRFKFAYQVGGRFVNGVDSLANKNIAFFNGLANAGFFFQTGAWRNDDTDNMGVFYLQAKGNFSSSSKTKIEKVFPQINTNFLVGYSIDTGIVIDKVINLKLSVFQFLNADNYEEFKKPIIKFSLDYTLNE